MLKLILLLVSFGLITILGTFGFFWSIFYLIFWKGLKELNNYFYGLAFSFDQTGNVICQHLFNLLLMKPGGHKFGNPDETISQVLGINKYHYSTCYVTPLGNEIIKALNRLDKDHIIKAYEAWIIEFMIEAIIE